MINEDNFEIYLVDYLDGTLSVAEKKEVENFLLLNPPVKKMLEGIENAKLIPPDVNFPCKNKLKKLSTEKFHFETEHPEFLHSVLEELNILEKDFRLKPNRSIVYPYKTDLYKYPQVKRFWKNIIAVASVILLLITVSFTVFFNKNWADTQEEIYMVKEAIMRVETQSSIALLENSDPFVSSSIIVKEYIPSLPPIEPLDMNTLSYALPMSSFVLINSELPTTDIIIKDEIILTTQAQDWKPSEEVFSSKNLFNSIYEVGKNLTEKMKNQE